jgi:hypothetical protein
MIMRRRRTTTTCTACQAFNMLILAHIFSTIFSFLGSNGWWRILQCNLGAYGNLSLVKMRGI